MTDEKYRNLSSIFSHYVSGALYANDGCLSTHKMSSPRSHSEDPSHDPRSDLEESFEEVWHSIVSSSEESLASVSLDDSELAAFKRETQMLVASGQLPSLLHWALTDWLNATSPAGYLNSDTERLAKKAFDALSLEAVKSPFLRPLLSRASVLLVVGSTERGGLRLPAPYVHGIRRESSNSNEKFSSELAWEESASGKEVSISTEITNASHSTTDFQHSCGGNRIGMMKFSPSTHHEAGEVNENNSHSTTVHKHVSAILDARANSDSSLAVIPSESAENIPYTSESPSIKPGEKLRNGISKYMLSHPSLDLSCQSVEYAFQISMEVGGAEMVDEGSLSIYSMTHRFLDATGTEEDSRDDDTNNDFASNVLFVEDIEGSPLALVEAHDAHNVETFEDAGGVDTSTMTPEERFAFRVGTLGLLEATRLLELEQIRFQSRPLRSLPPTSSSPPSAPVQENNEPFTDADQQRVLRDYVLGGTWMPGAWVESGPAGASSGYSSAGTTPTRARFDGARADLMVGGSPERVDALLAERESPVQDEINEDGGYEDREGGEENDLGHHDPPMKNVIVNAGSDKESELRGSGSPGSPSQEYVTWNLATVSVAVGVLAMVSLVLFRGNGGRRRGNRTR
ncbi:hypothetical protein BC830DRAFT_1109916 [Chytriomyces sp. MP71]|nr:hypothetical protein BC830DRAFT_1109916 [Chytriomyces sp. MP71]